MMSFEPHKILVQTCEPSLIVVSVQWDYFCLLFFTLVCFFLFCFVLFLAFYSYFPFTDLRIVLCAFLSTASSPF